MGHKRDRSIIFLVYFCRDIISNHLISIFHFHKFISVALLALGQYSSTETYFRHRFYELYATPAIYDIHGQYISQTLNIYIYIAIAC